jgi:GntR family transcriptional regulator
LSGRRRGRPRRPPRGCPRSPACAGGHLSGPQRLAARGCRRRTGHAPRRSGRRRSAGPRHRPGAHPLAAADWDAVSAQVDVSRPHLHHEETGSQRLAANWLEIEEGSEVVLRRRLFLADEEPIQINDGYLPRDLVAGTDLETPRLITEGTYTMLERIGHKPLKCSEELSARMPTAEEIDLLHLRQNVPVMDVRIT